MAAEASHAAAPSPDDMALALALAADAREIALRHFGTGLAVERKADATPVTEADREIERRLRERIARERPADGILGEEQGAEGADRARVWVLDPIDGTKAFITAWPPFGTLIALAQDGVAVLGVVEVPALGERFAGTAPAGGRPRRGAALLSAASAASSSPPRAPRGGRGRSPHPPRAAGS